MPKEERKVGGTVENQAAAFRGDVFRATKELLALPPELSGFMLFMVRPGPGSTKEVLTFQSRSIASMRVAHMQPFLAALVQFFNESALAEQAGIRSAVVSGDAFRNIVGGG